MIFQYTQQAIDNFKDTNIEFFAEVTKAFQSYYGKDCEIEFVEVSDDDSSKV